MMEVCPAPDPRAGLVQGLLATVDCGVRGFAQAGYESLTEPPSPLPALVTAGLTIYVALLGWGLMSGRGPRLADAPLLAVKIGVVLALTASWPLFQTLVFRTAFDGGDEFARAAVAALPLAGSPWTALQAAYDQIVAAAAHYAAQAGPDADPRQGGAALAAESLWAASGMLLASTLYVAMAAKVMVGALTAVGPLFVALFMIDQTRGLFVGWLRALLLSALGPLFATLVCAFLLVLLQPQLATLAQSIATGQTDLPQVIGLTSLVLVGALASFGLALAAAIIGLGFRLADKAAPADAPLPPTVHASAAPPPSRAAAVAAGVEASMMRERLEQTSHASERRTVGLAAPGSGGAGQTQVPNAPVGRRLRREGFR